MEAAGQFRAAGRDDGRGRPRVGRERTAQPRPLAPPPPRRAHARRRGSLPTTNRAAIANPLALPSKAISRKYEWNAAARLTRCKRGECETYGGTCERLGMAERRRRFSAFMVRGGLARHSLNDESGAFPESFALTRLN